jgi:hypothetical protein
MLLQNPDDLLFRIPALLHQQLPHSIYERTSDPNGRYFRGQVTAKLCEECAECSDLCSGLTCGIVTGLSTLLREEMVHIRIVSGGLSL